MEGEQNSGVCYLADNLTAECYYEIQGFSCVVAKRRSNKRSKGGIYKILLRITLVIYSL